MAYTEGNLNLKKYHSKQLSEAIQLTLIGVKTWTEGKHVLFIYLFEGYSDTCIFVFQLTLV